MDKTPLPRPAAWHRPAARGRPARMPRHRTIRLVAVACLIFLVYSQWTQLGRTSERSKPAGNAVLSSERLKADIATCGRLQRKPRDPSGPRDRNARYIDGHKPTLIRNATVWTGEPLAGGLLTQIHHGTEYAWIQADVLLEYGLIKKVAADISVDDLPKDCHIYEANGRQLTAGIIDMHSHAGVDSLPSLDGNEDTNEMSADTTPYVRSIDGIHPLDHQIQVIKSGGVTTSLILPGSGNNIGGEAYVIKFAVGKPDGRSEISANDMLADPDRNWRYMKMACGENPKNVYGKVGVRGPVSRLGESWEFRHAFDQARQLVRAQDDWCTAASANGVHTMSTYLPQELQWESLAAVLRGQVHVNTHCYTIPDLEAFVDHTNEFSFAVRAFHHAHETFMVPEILKRAWGRPPASALFADNMYYKAEAYRGSESAGKILYDAGLTPVYVSDNPVINAQHVVFEAAKAYRYGLPYHVALAGVTSASAELLGLGERIGKVKAGFDADVVVWDSDPLSAGATPVQIWIDGTAQYEKPVVLKKPLTPPIDHKSPLHPRGSEGTDMDNVVISGISTSWIPSIKLHTNQSATVIIEDGKIVCTGPCNDHPTLKARLFTQLNLTNGHLTPPITVLSPSLGLSEIDQESDTQDGGNPATLFPRAIDGLALGGKQLAAAHRHGVARAITAPTLESGGSQGVSVGFRTHAAHALAHGAVWASEAAVHYTLSLAAKSETTPSISAAVGALRTRLLSAAAGNDSAKARYEEAGYLRRVLKGELALAVRVESADTIAALLRVKEEVESATNDTIRLVVVGGGEAHLLAKELAAAKVGVVLAPLFQYAQSWDERRSLSGAPLTNGTAVDVLVAAGVKVAAGIVEGWEARNLGLMAGIAHFNGEGRLSEEEAWGLVSANLEDMFGLKPADSAEEFVIWEGSPYDIRSDVVAVGSGLGAVTVFDYEELDPMRRGTR